MSPKNTRVAGHTLWYEGAPHDDRGHRIWRPYGSASGRGRGKCSCGALSEMEFTAAARKRWHAEHKQQVKR